MVQWSRGWFKRGSLADVCWAQSLSSRAHNSPSLHPSAALLVLILYLPIIDALHWREWDGKRWWFSSCVCCTYFDSFLLQCVCGIWVRAFTAQQCKETCIPLRKGVQVGGFSPIFSARCIRWLFIKIYLYKSPYSMLLSDSWVQRK